MGEGKLALVKALAAVYPEKIETTLMAHPAVAEAAVTGVPDAARGEEIAAFVVLRRAVSDDEPRAWCRERLAPDQQPRDILCVNQLPRNSSGKVQKIYSNKWRCIENAELPLETPARHACLAVRICAIAARAKNAERLKRLAFANASICATRRSGKLMFRRTDWLLTRPGSISTSIQ